MARHDDCGFVCHCQSVPDVVYGAALSVDITGLVLYRDELTMMLLRIETHLNVEIN